MKTEVGAIEWGYKLLIIGVALLYINVAKGQIEEGNKYNKDQYFEGDAKQNEYNYNDRVQIDQPLMPKLDMALDSTVLSYSGQKRLDQQDAFTNRKYYYPAKPKNQFELGIHGGIAGILGDVRNTQLGNSFPLPGYGAGITLRKGFGYLFSLRMRYLYSSRRGLNDDFSIDSEVFNNPVLNGSDAEAANYTTVDANGNISSVPFYYNYQSTIHDIGLEGVFSFGNKRFHREKTKVVFELFLGAGAIAYNTKIDALNDNAEHDFAEANALFAGGEAPDRGQLITTLEEILDGDYETTAERDPNATTVGDLVLKPSFTVGTGIAFALSRTVNLSIFTKFNFQADDLIDGARHIDPGKSSRGNDILNYTGIGINFNIGKKGLQPLWWQNPVQYSYQKLAENDPNPLIAALVADDDEDGVPNRFDEEENTPKNCPVSVKGVALDSDKDGCLDCQDMEPFSPPGYPMDENCRAIIPEPECDDVVANCENIEMPSVYFDANRYFIKPEYFAHLHSIAEKMHACPDVNMVAVGFTDIRRDPKYNEKLSWNRVNTVIDYLESKYGISRERFIVQYRGDSEADREASGFKQDYERRVDFRFAQEGETGDSNPPDPHPGLKAGIGNKK